MRLIALMIFVIGSMALLTPAPAIAQQGGGAKTLTQLSKPLTLNITDTRFEDIVEYVRTATGATIDIAWINNRYSEGLDPEALITLNVKEAPALSLLLHAASRATIDDFDTPTWQLDKDTGAIQIGPRSRLNKFKRLEIYDIHDLLLVLPDYSDVPQLNLNSVLRQGQGGGGSGIFQQAQGQKTDTDPRAEAQRIIEILETVIETDQWIDNGGDGATIRFYDGNLLISAPDYIHRQINGYSFLTGPVGRPAIATAKADAEDEGEHNEAQADDRAEKTEQTAQ